MLAHPTLDQLHALGLHGLAKGFKDLEHNAEARGLDHAEWLGLLLEYELTLRRQKQFETRARVAKLRHPASVEDVNYQSPRGLDRALFLKLSTEAAWSRGGSGRRAHDHIEPRRPARDAEAPIRRCAPCSIGWARRERRQ